MTDSSAKPAGFDADVIVVGAGLAGLVAACELVERGLRVLILDQENSANLGGQAFWSFGGLFFVDSPEQRRLGIRDSHELALQDWLGTAAFLIRSRVLSGPPGPVQAFVDRGVDFVSAHSLRELVTGMDKLPDVVPLDYATVEAEVTARDREVANRFSKDGQITAIRAARGYLGDRLGRVVAPHRLTDPKAGPLIAVKLHILTRKTLGGIEPDLQARVLKADGTPLAVLYAAGEVAGFGGGGVHGYRALEGTFLGGCIFSGRAAGRGAANDIT